MNDESWIFRIGALTDQVIENTMRNELTNKNAEKLDKVEQRMTTQHIQVTTYSSNTVVGPTYSSNSVQSSVD